ncbi:MAG: pilus assembly protein PilM [Persicimonas sp.]
MSNTIIGLDFGTHSIKLVRLQPGREPRILEYDQEPLVRAPEEFDPSERFGADDADEQSEEPPEAADGAVGPGEEAPSNDAASEQTPDAPAAADPDSEEDGDTDEMEPPAPWELALERLIDRGAFDDDGLVVTFLPDGKAMSIRENVPFVERDKVENILPHMLDDRLPVEVSDVVYDFQLLETTTQEEGAEAMIGFARRDEIGAFLSGLKKHRIDPAILGIPELLLGFGLQRSAPTREGTFAVVDIGHRFTRLLVLKEREPVAARSFQFGGHQLTEAIAEAFDATYEQAEKLKETHGKLLGPDASPTGDERALGECLEEALGPLVRDLRRTFQSLYARSRTEVDEVFLCGGTSRLEELPGHLEREFGIAVSRLRLDELSGVIDDTTSDDGRPEFALAASTALQQIDGRGEEHLIDLRKDEFTYRGKASFLRRQLFKYGAAVGVIFLLVFGMLFTQKMELEAQRDAMHEALGESTRELFGTSVYTSDEITNRLAGEQGSKRSFVPEMSAYQLYYELTKRVPDDMEVELERFEVDIDRNIAQIYGEATDAEAVGRLEDELSKLECLEDVRQEGDLTIRNDSEVDFHLHVSSNCS